MNKFFIDPNPANFGSDATEEEARQMAEKIKTTASDEFPNVEFVIGYGAHKFDDSEKLADVIEYINGVWNEA